MFEMRSDTAEIEKVLQARLQEFKADKISASEFADAARTCGYVDEVRKWFLYAVDEAAKKINVPKKETSARALIQNVFRHADDVEIIELPRAYIRFPEDVDLQGLNAGALLKYEDHNAVDKNVVPFLQHALTNGVVTTPSPFSGEMLSTDRGLLVYSAGRTHLFYFFKDQEPFFLIINAFAGCKSGFFFPQRNLVIGQKPLGYAGQIAALKMMCATNTRNVRKYLYGGEQTTPVVTLSFMTHFGHTLFNELNGVDSAIAMNLPVRNYGKLIGPHEFMPTEDVFPELDTSNINRVSNGIAAFEYILKNNHLPVRPTVGNYWITKTFRERMRKFAEQHVPASALPNSHNSSPLIWIEIRSNDRVWLNQIEEIPVLISRIKAIYPNASFILAGWSRTLKPTAKDDLEITNDKNIVTALREALGDETCIIDGVGLTTIEKFGWAFQIDAFVSTLGSGMLLPCYLANKPGVVHSNTYYAVSPMMDPDFGQRLLYSEALTPFEVVEPKFVEDDPDQENMQICGHRVSGDIIADRLISALEKAWSSLTGYNIFQQDRRRPSRLKGVARVEHHRR